MLVGELGRRAAGRCEAGLVLVRLLGEVKVKRRTAFAGPRRRPRPSSAGRRLGRCGWPHRRVTSGLRGRHLLGPGRPAVDVAVGEALLHRVERAAVEARPQVARVEQDQPDAREAGGLADGVVHPRRLVQVVELVHRRDPGQHELAERGRGERQQPVGVEPVDEAIHLRRATPRSRRRRLGRGGRGGRRVSGRRRGRAGRALAARRSPPLAGATPACTDVSRPSSPHSSRTRVGHAAWQQRPLGPVRRHRRAWAGASRWYGPSGGPPGSRRRRGGRRPCRDRW